MRNNKEENHSLFNEGVTKIVFKYQKKLNFALFRTFIFMFACEQKKVPKNFIEIQTMFTVVIWVWFSLKTSQLFLFSAIIRPNRQTYMRRWKEHTKKTVEKVHEMMLMWAQKKLSRRIFFLLVIFCVCTFRSLHSSIECGSGGNRHAVGKEKEAITIGTVRHTFFHFERNIHVNVSGIWNVGDSILVYIEDMRRRRRKKELKSRKRLYLHTWKHERETNHVRYAPMLLLLLLSIHDEFPFLGVIRELSTADEQFAEKQCKEKAQGKLFNLKLWWVFNLRSSIKQIFHQVPSSPCTSLENSKEKKWKKFH